MGKMCKYRLVLICGLQSFYTIVYAQQDLSGFQKEMEEIQRISSSLSRLEGREKNKYSTAYIYVMEISSSPSVIAGLNQLLNQLSSNPYLSSSEKSAASREINKAKNYRETIYYGENEKSAYDRDVQSLKSYSKYLNVTPKGKQSNPRAKSFSNTANSDTAFGTNTTQVQTPQNNFADNNFSAREQNKMILADENTGQNFNLNAGDISKYIEPKNEIKEVVDFCKQAFSLSQSFCTCILGKFAEKEEQDVNTYDIYNEENAKKFNAYVNEINSEIKNQIRNVYEENKHLDMALLANDVYESGSTLPAGWKIADETNLPLAIVDGLNYINSTDRDVKDGFYAQIYYNEEYKEYTISFRGTEILSYKDWKQNKRQAFGETGQANKEIIPAQYEKAKALAIGLKNRCSDCNINITGHSLGGGLASLAGQATGLKTYTYNAAAVNEKTMKRLGVPYDGKSDKENIEAYSISNEILRYGNKKTDSFGTVELGRQIDLGVYTPTVGEMIIDATVTSIVTDVETIAPLVDNRFVDDNSALEYSTMAHRMPSVLEKLKSQEKKYFEKLEVLGGIKKQLNECYVK